MTLMLGIEHLTVTAKHLKGTRPPKDLRRQQRAECSSRYRRAVYDGCSGNKHFKTAYAGDRRLYCADSM